MDLNDLFYRQQLERSKADAAPSSEERDLHEGLARKYEEQIAAARTPDPEAGSLFQWRSSPPDIAAGPQVNAPMAVAMTARELDRPASALGRTAPALGSKDQLLNRA
jgi:hypothetical protein